MVTLGGVSYCLSLVWMGEGIVLVWEPYKALLLVLCCDCTWCSNALVIIDGAKLEVDLRNVYLHIYTYIIIIYIYGFRFECDMMRSCIQLDMAIAFRHIQSVKVLLACSRLKIVMFHSIPTCGLWSFFRTAWFSNWLYTSTHWKPRI